LTGVEADKLDRAIVDFITIPCRHAVSYTCNPLGEQRGPGEEVRASGGNFERQRGAVVELEAEGIF
jgi:hypothetical protein